VTSRTRSSIFGKILLLLLGVSSDYEHARGILPKSVHGNDIGQRLVSADKGVDYERVVSIVA
jgi:hypothetical protein